MGRKVGRTVPGVNHKNSNLEISSDEVFVRFSVEIAKGLLPIVRTGLMIAVLLTLTSPLQAQTAREIIDRVDRLMRGESSQRRVSMGIKTEHFTRSLERVVWSLGTAYSLVRVEKPAREAGTATLKADQEVWSYLPRVDRTIKVPPSLMMGSWMGSHFTNDDLVKESRIVDDSDCEIAFEGLGDRRHGKLSCGQQQRVSVTNTW